MHGKPKLKPLSDQVMVITGATSGIGLVTAREAARRGARLVLVARDEDALRKLVDEMDRNGFEATYVAADVGVEADSTRIAEAAVKRFGGFDTWVSNAGVSIYGPIDAPTTDEYRRLFDTNFWGAVFGALTARKYLRQRGGAIIAVGSAASEFAIPIQGMYSASKHAIKGFMDAFRLEVKQDRDPIAVTLVKPASINTPLPGHAVNYMPYEPRLPPPIYAPEAVAATILYAAEHPSRELFVGGSGAVGALGRHLFPRLTDTLLNTFARDWQTKSSRETRTGTGILFEPGDNFNERYASGGPTLEYSPYTYATTRGKWIALSLGAAALAYGIVRYRR